MSDKELAEGEAGDKLQPEGRVTTVKNNEKPDIFGELLGTSKEEKSEALQGDEQEKNIEPEKEKPAKAGKAKPAKQKKRKLGMKVVTREGKKKGKKEAVVGEEPSQEAGEGMDAPEDEINKWAGEIFQEEFPEVGEELLPDEIVHELGTKEEGTKEKPPYEEIKKTILKKAELSGERDSKSAHGIKLSFLEDEAKGNVFIGMKKNIFRKYGYDGALFVGKVYEEERQGSSVYLDSLNPHVIFVCGARGSGKSYVLGVMAEELALHNHNVGMIVIDPIGVFWSMKFPNREEKEIKTMVEWGIEPKGLDNIRVFIPDGVRGSVPKSTYDSGFSMQPSLLSCEDWCLTFGIERFSPTGLLLDKALGKVEKGYRKLEDSSRVEGKGKKYSIDDLIECLETDSELNSRERGYKQDSIRALSSRFDAAKGWGIFSESGTPLSELSREGQMTILDTSFLEDNVTALVIGILARRVLSARKLSTRKEAANRFKGIGVDELLELEIPPTWLFIDEAHTLIPSGGEKTPATNALVEYVKQGRRPGCSVVFATQQPSAIDTKVLSQLDIIMCHKLVFDDDIKAVYRRTPTIIPMSYKRSNFIKTLPVGVALTGDRREETSRAFIMSIRPRMSQHEGRDAETAELTRNLSPKEVELLATELILKALSKERMLELPKVTNVVTTLNAKYRTSAKVDDVLAALKKKKVIVGEESIMLEAAKPREQLPGEEETAAEKGEEAIGEVGVGEEAAELMGKVGEVPLQAGKTELLSLPVRIGEAQARAIAESARKKKFLGLIGDNEQIKSLSLKYFTIWKALYDVFGYRNEFVSRECFVDSRTGEFIHFADGRFVLSKGMANFYSLSNDETKVLSELMKNELLAEEIMHRTGFSEGRTLRIVAKLMEQGLAAAAVDKRTGKKIYWLRAEFELPSSEKHAMLPSLNNLPLVRVEAVGREKEKYSREVIPDVLGKLWQNIVVKDIKEVYRPVWEARLEMKGMERRMLIDAVTGRII